jgi:hypothetical protein
MGPNYDPLMVELIIAWFALDDLMVRTCHVSARAIELRESCGLHHDLELKIKKSVEPILVEHRNWLKRKVVVDALEAEKIGRLLASAESKEISQMTDSASVSSALSTSQSLSLYPQSNPRQFLDHEPLQVTNPFFANLLNHHRSIELSASLILRPAWGMYDPRRFQCAVDLCRTHAALGDERNFLNTGKIWGLHFAGVTFGGPSLHAVYSIMGIH